MQCVVNMLFLTLEQVFGGIKSLSVYRSTFMLTGKLFARTLLPYIPQQERISPAQYACEVLSIE